MYEGKAYQLIHVKTHIERWHFSSTANKPFHSSSVCAYACTHVVVFECSKEIDGKEMTRKSRFCSLLRSSSVIVIFLQFFNCPKAGNALKIYAICSTPRSFSLNMFLLLLLLLLRFCVRMCVRVYIFHQLNTIAICQYISIAIRSRISSFSHYLQTSNTQTEQTRMKCSNHIQAVDGNNDDSFVALLISNCVSFQTFEFVWKRRKKKSLLFFYFVFSLLQMFEFFKWIFASFLLFAINFRFGLVGSQFP